VKFFRVILAAVGFYLFVSPASAQVIGFDLEYYTQYDQNTDSLQTAEFETNLYTEHANDLTGVNLITPLSFSDQLQYVQDWFYAHTNSDLTTLTTIFPNGTYTLNTTGGSVGTQTFTLSANGELPSEQTYTNLPSLGNDNPNNPITITFQPFVADVNASTTALTLDIDGSNGEDYAYQLSPSATQYTLPGGTLAANTTFNLSLREENEYLVTPPVGDSDFSTSYNIYESNTEATFETSSVPEPASWVELALGICVLVVAPRLARCPR